MSFSEDIQLMLDQHEEKNRHVLVSFQTRRHLVYEWLTTERQTNNRKKGDWGMIDINEEALDFSYTYGADEIRALNLYTFVLLQSLYVPPYCDWIVEEGEEYYYDPLHQITFYYSSSGNCYNTCAGMMKGTKYKSVGDIVVVDNNGKYKKVCAGMLATKRDPELVEDGGDGG